jgi:hypothetical protein
MRVEFEDELADHTTDWTLPVLVRRYEDTPDGHRRFSSEASILHAHNYEISAQREAGSHLHAGRLILTGGWSVFAGRKGIRSRGSFTVTYMNKNRLGLDFSRFEIPALYAGGFPDIRVAEISSGILAVTPVGIELLAGTADGRDDLVIPFETILDVTTRDDADGAPGVRVVLERDGTELSIAFETAEQASAERFVDRVQSYEQLFSPRRPTVTGEPVPEPDLGSEVLKLIKDLGQLRDAGLLSNEEFNAKKAELLARL